MAVLFDQHLKAVFSESAIKDSIRLYCTCASCKADMIIAGAKESVQIPQTDRWVVKLKNAEKYTELTTCPVCHGSLGFNFTTSFGTPADAEENADRYFGQYLSEKELRTLKAHFEYEYSEIDRDNIYATSGANMYTYYSQNGPFDWTYIVHRSSIGVYPIWRHILKMKDEQSVEQKLSTLLSGVLPAAAPTTDTKTKIMSSPDALKAFISQLFNVETNIYSLGKRLTDLYMQQIECARNIRRHKGLAELDLRKQTILTEAAYDQATKELSRIQRTNPDALATFHQPKPSKPKVPVLEKPGLFNKKRVLAYNEQLTAKYQQALAEYERALAEYERAFASHQHKIEAQHTQALSAAEAEVAEAKARMEQSATNIDAQIEAACALPSPETVAKQMLDDEIVQAEKLLKELIECRSKLYACDVVFIKYRNMVALATFYEYLISGRCTTLEGPDGAYNIFESECRANQIIGQLNKIVDSLEQIKESQYLIYSQLQSINSSLTTMNATMQSMSQSLQSIQADASNISGYMEKVAQNSDVIAHNTAVNAYYAKMNAELTNSLGYLVALR